MHTHTVMHLPRRSILIPRHHSVHYSFPLVLPYVRQRRQQRVYTRTKSQMCLRTRALDIPSRINHSCLCDILIFRVFSDSHHEHGATATATIPTPRPIPVASVSLPLVFVIARLDATGHRPLIINLPKPCSTGIHSEISGTLLRNSINCRGSGSESGL